MTPLGDSLLFGASDESIYKLSAAGTLSVVHDGQAHPGTFSPGPLPVAGGIAFFVLMSGLWKTDGTQAGTILVKDLSSTGARLDGLTVSGDRVYFRVSHLNSQYDLWRSDGTAPGTVAVPGSNGQFGTYPTLWPIGQRSVL